MPQLALRRDKLKTFRMGTGTHPNLMLRRGLSAWPEDGNAEADKATADKIGEIKAGAIDDIARIRPDDGYRWAYRRWCASTVDADDGGSRFHALEAEVVGRLYIGLSRESPLETGITVQHAWGMPMIPGSAVKGVCRQVARDQSLPGEVERHLFGNMPKDDEGEAGAVVFHDAWWVPVSAAGGSSKLAAGHAPFVAEVVTPHHTDYYNLGKAAATEFDNPVPAPQVATQGRFRFVVEGDPQWRKLALALLRIALTRYGIGGKTTSGYGLFDLVPTADG